MPQPLSLRRLAAVAAALAAPLLVAPAAHAGLLVATASDCDEQVLERPFLRWADPAHYVLVPNGVLEGPRGWELDGDADIRRGNERFHVHGQDEHTSLSLPRGASATTKPICVGIEHPTLRFFARNEGSFLSTLSVEVLFEDAAGETHALPIGVVLGGSEWRPTPPFPLVVNLLPLLPGERTAVAFRFRTAGAGEWSIDDVYVDPWRHG